VHFNAKEKIQNSFADDAGISSEPGSPVAAHLALFPENQMKENFFDYAD
jgi:hypothetical protein